MFGFRHENRINKNDNEVLENKTNNLSKKIDKLNNILIKSNILDISSMLGNKKEIFFRNFLAGISRGIGIGIGVTLITALLIFILQKIVTLNIPVIGEYISDLVDIVMNYRY